MSGEHSTTARTAAGDSSWLSGFRLDVVVATLALLLVAGVALDFRSHAHGVSFEEEGFFTPEHVFFYSMFLGIAAVVGAATYRNRRSGAAWTDAVPPGYGWAAVGVVVFGLGGVGDFLWHSAFGFEEEFEALTSPSHLALAAGAVLFLSAPLRAALVRDRRYAGVTALPAIVSASLVAAILALFALYANPLAIEGYLPIHGEMHPAQLVAVIAFPTLLVGTALVLARSFVLPPGGLTLALLGPGIASVLPSGRFELLVPVVVAGVVGDALVRWRRPSTADPLALRAFGAAVPLSFAATYFAVVELVAGVTWTIHVWTGAIALAGMAGLLLTYAILPVAGWEDAAP